MQRKWSRLCVSFLADFGLDWEEIGHEWKRFSAGQIVAVLKQTPLDLRGRS
jgi:hypothetical protein